MFFARDLDGTERYSSAAKCRSLKWFGEVRLVRMQFIVRRKKLSAASTGFIKVLIVSRVIQDIQHWPYVLAHAGGCATGTLLGMHLSERLSKQVVQATVILHGLSSAVEAAIREVAESRRRHVYSVQGKI